ncbi:MAG: hypothetical protein RR408_00970 [Carnobacterium sp.]
MASIALVYFPALFITGTNDVMNQFPYLFGLVFFIAGTLSWFIRNKLPKKEQHLFDENGNKVIIKNTHSFFFIEVKYFIIVFYLIGLYQLLKGLF